MNIEAFLLCDAATEFGGKLNVLGRLTRFLPRSFRRCIRLCAVALRLRFDRIEQGQHRVRLNFVDADGNAVLPPLDASINIGMRAEDASVCANLVLNIQGVKLEKAGMYSIDLAIDGRHEKSLPLFVKPSAKTGKRARKNSIYFAIFAALPSEAGTNGERPRSRFTISGIFAITRSTSASVLYRLRLKRIEPWAAVKGTPIARRT